MRSKGTTFRGKSVPDPSYGDKDCFCHGEPRGAQDVISGKRGELLNTSGDLKPATNDRKRR